MPSSASASRYHRPGQEGLGRRGGEVRQPLHDLLPRPRPLLHRRRRHAHLHDLRDARRRAEGRDGHGPRGRRPALATSCSPSSPKAWPTTSSPARSARRLASPLPSRLVVGFLRWPAARSSTSSRRNVTTRSLIISYCLGVSITFVTVVIASMKVSGVNIVAAIRGLDDDGQREKPAEDQLEVGRSAAAGDGRPAAGHLVPLPQGLRRAVGLDPRADRHRARSALPSSTRTAVAVGSDSSRLRLLDHPAVHRCHAARRTTAPGACSLDARRCCTSRPTGCCRSTSPKRCSATSSRATSRCSCSPASWS